MIKKKILKIFNKVMKTKHKSIPYSEAFNKKQWDSLNHIRLIAEIEKNLNINLGFENIGKMNNLKKIILIVSNVMKK
jgi:acyl carrier protein